jgi:hypothetical protein
LRAVREPPADCHGAAKCSPTAAAMQLAIAMTALFRSVGGGLDPALAAAFGAAWRINFAAGLRRLPHHGKSSAVALRTFTLSRFYG